MLDWFVILSQEDKSQDVRLETGNKTDYQPFQLLSFENIENAQKQMKQILNAFFNTGQWKRQVVKSVLDE